MVGIVFGQSCVHHLRSVVPAWLSEVSKGCDPVLKPFVFALSVGRCRRVWPSFARLGRRNSRPNSTACTSTALASVTVAQPAPTSMIQIKLPFAPGTFTYTQTHLRILFTHFVSRFWTSLVLFTPCLRFRFSIPFLKKDHKGKHFRLWCYRENICVRLHHTNRPRLFSIQQHIPSCLFIYLSDFSVIFFCLLT